MAWTQSDLDNLETRIATARKTAQAGSMLVTEYEMEELLLRIRGILLIILLVVAVLALGWGLVQLVALPFGGIDPVISLFWGFLVVLVALGVMYFIGRRRQRTARANAAEQRANAVGTGRAARRSGGGGGGT